MRKRTKLSVILLATLMISVTVFTHTHAYEWPSRSLQFGITGDDVLSLQTALTEAGYSLGSLDGVFGSMTEQALLNFQSDHGLIVDGIAGNQTFTALYGTQTEQTQQVQPTHQTQSTSAFGSRTLSYGTAGSDVTELQQRLSASGFYYGAIDGDFGAMTRQAVMEYQNANGLDVDGVVGPLTLKTLNGTQTQPTQTAQQAQAVSDVANTSTVLAVGSRGDNVTALQQKLQSLGYYSGTIDGDFGRMTEAAVIAYQKAKGLDADGIAGPMTLSTLKKEQVNTAQPAQTTPAEQASEELEPQESEKKEEEVLTQYPVLVNISNAPGGIQVDWTKTQNATTYRIFRLSTDGTWQAIGETADIHYIDTNVVSGNRYTYTVRALNEKGEYTGDYDTGGISFTYCYNYDSYVASAPASITKAMVEKKAKEAGLDKNEIMGLIAWVEGEKYSSIGEDYMEYLAACVVINGLQDNVYNRGEDFIKQMRTWGSYYEKEKLKKRYENASQSTLFAVYLALTHPQPGLYFCRGADEKPANCFYDAGFEVGGQAVYVW